MSKFMTVQEAADELKVSTWSVYRLLWDGQVQSIKVGRCRRIVRQSFDAYVSGLIESAA
ncbi:excisionase family DNA-binding protein [Nocardia terpenica]|uniref:excisionase family DNA-binding protein n=1 Tax=Nocardia terpenica TaxID=455432 RepID=UPI000B0D29EA|nr:excisionase family DNA-binding protein [Nocardia terpenica]NQE91075.1 helix-turn-helix domain-containing protein [Nocardia terpenica]